MQSEIKCEPCCSSSNWYSDFYSEIYPGRPFPEFSPFHRHCPIDKASDIHRHGAVIVQRKGGERTWRENWPFAHTASLILPRIWRSVHFFIRPLLPCRDVLRQGRGKKITKFRLRNGHDIYRLVIYIYTYKITIHMCRIHVKFCKKCKQDCTAGRRKLNRLETVHNHTMFSSS